MSTHWNHNIHYHRLVLAAMPSPCGEVLDIGCGEGLLTRELAVLSQKVTGIDPDQSSLEKAALRDKGLTNIAYIKGDALTYPFSPENFNLIASIATLHHLPLEIALNRFRDLLAPGGKLIIIGLYQTQSLTDHLYAALGLLYSLILRRVKPYRQINAPATKPLQTLRGIKQAAKTILPGAIVKRRLLFRYSLIWVKPM